MDCHSSDKNLPCPKCKFRFISNAELKKHENSHKSERSVQDFQCTKCAMVFTTKTELEEHDESHSVVSSQCSEAKCNKCEKVYSNISKLRRHDWRAHREISCNICDELLQSREEISIHRQTKHQISERRCALFSQNAWMKMNVSFNIWI